ncbi:FAD-dependent oxidoreductase [Acidocella sp.]|uniref:FAD-dependent oxidoreductase n=1 Tax=Acidocella sp. TaxID=50710 RepID=UPI003CFFB6C5
MDHNATTAAPAWTSTGQHEWTDVLVIGSGAAGLAAAVTAATRGLSVLVAEKAPLFGGTTALSGGWLWIPHNPAVRAAGIEEPEEAPRLYLRAILGNQYDDRKIDTYLKAGPRMAAFFTQNTEVKFLPGTAAPDFHGNHPSAVKGGRSMVAAPYDGKALGPLLSRMRQPIPETTFLGMGIASGADLYHFLHATRKPSSLLHVSKRVGEHLKDLALHGRAMQLVNGNALTARLLRSAADKGVILRENLEATSLTHENNRVTGAVLQSPQGALRVTARRAVILATGGFPHDTLRQQAHFPHTRTGMPHASAAPLENNGAGMRLGEQAGGHVREDLVDSGAWAPVSLPPRRNGTIGRFPHLVDRAKPGLIAVTATGKRFVNESGPYHDFMRGLFTVIPPGEPVQAWLICDSVFLHRYGLGAAKPFPVPKAFYLNNGYLKRGKTIADLALACGINAPTLAQTIATHNADLARGEDSAFGRGSTLFQRVSGDPDIGPNPCLAPIAKAPFYAVRIVPGSLGTFAGLDTDEHARVLDENNQPIPGLFAVGNDMSSIMGGHYPSGGITLGPAMTFGWIAANFIADHQES